MVKPPMLSSASYLRFLSLVRASEQGSDFPRLNPMEAQLLNDLALCWHRGERVPVLRALAMATASSPSTTHRRLKALLAKGVVELSVDESDQRVKYVGPSSRCLEYFQHLGRLMSEALKPA